MPFRVRKKDEWTAQKMCSKGSADSTETLEEIKNHYIKEEDAWSHLFVKIIIILRWILLGLEP